MTVLLAEDEPLAATHLISLLGEVGFTYDVMEQVDSVHDLKKRLKEYPGPDLLLLDIQLSDGMSLTVFDEMKIAAPVIFITAFDNYAMKIFEANSLTYLLKPLHKNALQKALEKYSTIADFYQQKKLPQKLERRERVIVKKGNARLSVAFNSIAFFYAEMKLTFAVDFCGDRYLVDQNLSQVEEQMEPKTFFRISRQFIVNINAIKEFKPIEFSKIELCLLPNNYIRDSIIVSQFTAPDFKKWIYNL